MDASPGTPQLLTNIQFAEAKKGYDRDQVDNFLRELSTKIGELQDMLRQATARAEAAEARVAEATKAKVLAETMADKAKADAAKAIESAPAEPVNEVEAAAGMLALAQQTAEAAIAAAEARAKDVVADARSKAAMIVVEVEQEVERLKTAATEEAAALVSNRAAELEAEVARLASLRDGLQGDVDVLQSHLDEHRNRLREGVEALAKLLDGGGFDPIGGGGGGSGSKSSTSAFDAPAASDDAEPSVDLTDAAPVTAEADPSSEPIADAAPDALPVIEFVPEPEPTPAPALNLVAPISTHDEDDDAADDAATDGSESDERHPTAELTIVTLEDLNTGVADDGAFAPSTRVDPEVEHRAAQVANLLEAPDAAPTIEPEVVADEPAAAAAAEPEPEPEPEPEVAPATEASEGAEPVEQQAVEAAPVVIAATGTDGAGNAPMLNLTAARLFGEPTEGDPTQAFDVLGDEAPTPRLTLQRSSVLPSTTDESPLGEPDADADAAMRAFFEQDLTKLEREQAKSGRFLRRK